ncbi:MAG: DUF4347 domain-containing protein, partial [Cyanobacteria bacterium P01_H01_bin.58]
MLPTLPKPMQLASDRANDRALVILDSSIEHLPLLIADLPANADIFLLDSAQNPIEQITGALWKRPAVNSLHLVAHGASGSLRLGAANLNLDTLEHHAEQLRSWGEALNGGDLLIYGCQVAKGALGYLFLQQLHQLTGLNVAASTQTVGRLGSQTNWLLETQLGQVQTPIVFSEELQQTYMGNFVEVSFDIEQDVAIETEFTLVTFNFTLDQAPPPEGVVVVLSANETSSFNRFDPGFSGSNIQRNGISNNFLFDDVSPLLDFSAFALNITQ